MTKDEIFILLDELELEMYDEMNGSEFESGFENAMVRIKDRIENPIYKPKDFFLRKRKGEKVLREYPWLCQVRLNFLHRVGAQERFEKLYKAMKMQGIEIDVHKSLKHDFYIYRISRISYKP